MARVKAHLDRIGIARLCGTVMVLLVIAGVLKWFVPFLTRGMTSFAEVPSAPPLFNVTYFSVPPGKQACMVVVTVTPDSHFARFGLRPAKPTAVGGPPVLLKLDGAGYHSSVSVPGGYPGGTVTLPLVPPKHPVITTACFLNQGRTTVALTGTTETRTVSRTYMAIGGQSVYGDVALTFIRSKSENLWDELGDIFTRASNLTDGLIPPWAMWILAILLALGIPVAMIVAFYRALSEDFSGVN